MKTKYSKDELDGIMSEVTEVVDTLLKSEAASLAKAAEGASVQDAQDKKAQGGQPIAKASEPGSEPPADASASSTEATSAAPAADASASAPPADASAPADPAMGQSEAPTREELKSAYSQLSPEERAEHLAALQEVMAADAAPAAAPQASAPAAPGPSAAAPMPGDQSQGVAPEFAQKFEVLQTEHEALKKSLEGLVPALQIVLGQPKPKSITGEDVILKGGQDFSVSALSEKEFTDRLTKAARTENLSKSDRQAIDAYYRGQKRDRATVAHLVK